MNIITNLLYILAGVLLLGIIVAVHEFGHFISARIVGIPVKEFSIGFGPKLIAWKSKKHETIFKISAIPMGGYCMYYGETASDPDAKSNEEEVYAADDPRLYHNHKLWKRMFTVLSGPLMNFVLAIVVAIIMVAAYGSKVEGYRIGDFAEVSPAREAGLQVHDQILRIDGMDVNDGTQNGISSTINRLASPNKALTFEVLRDNTLLEYKVTPLYSEANGRYLIGTTIYPILGKIESSNVLPEALRYCKEASTAILNALGKLFTTGEGFNETAGPIGVIKTIGTETQRGGLSVYLNLAVIISINLGLFNLIPIPGLDGARFLLMVVEGIRRKPLNQKIEGYIHMVGYVLLFGLLIFITIRDVFRLFG